MRRALPVWLRAGCGEGNGIERNGFETRGTIQHAGRFLGELPPRALAGIYTVIQTERQRALDDGARRRCRIDDIRRRHRPIHKYRNLLTSVDARDNRGGAPAGLAMAVLRLAEQTFHTQNVLATGVSRKPFP